MKGEKTREPLHEKWVALAAAVNGKVAVFQSPVSKFSFQVIRTLGSSPTWTAKLQGSLDGANWVDLLTIANTDTAGETKSVVDKPMLAARIIVSAVSGTPTLEAFGLGIK